MRGKLILVILALPLLRITPADAGKTAEGTLSGFHKEDHPRGCGENEDDSLRQAYTSGSPPRMRGKLAVDAAPARNSRITPADAGKTPYITYEVATDRDHPRGCGENHSHEKCSRQWAGSPPRMRGKHRKGRNVVCFAGITPADAGKTIQCGTSRIGNWDHPRGCGENCYATELDEDKLGSPPRMRGKLRSKSKGRMTHGITPADAGKTRVRMPKKLPSKDHPRGCGENQHGGFLHGQKYGSPPRMRGKLCFLCWRIR